MTFNIIIELDGPQHFRQISNWDTPDSIRSLDVYKMQCANKSGYTVVRLLQTDVFSDLNNWQDKLRNAIRVYEKPECVYLTDSDIYKSHIEDMKANIPGEV